MIPFKEKYLKLEKIKAKNFNFYKVCLNIILFNWFSENLSEAMAFMQSIDKDKYDSIISMASDDNRNNAEFNDIVKFWILDNTNWLLSYILNKEED